MSQLTKNLTSQHKQTIDSILIEEPDYPVQDLQDNIVAKGYDKTEVDTYIRKSLSKNLSSYAEEQQKPLNLPETTQTPENIISEADTPNNEFTPGIPMETDNGGTDIITDKVLTDIEYVDVLDEAKKLVSKHDNIHRNQFTAADRILTKERYTNLATKIDNGLIQKFKDFGIQAEINGNQVYIIDDNGNRHKVTPSFWQSFKDRKFENAGALTGGFLAGSAALAAGQLGPQAALPEEIITVPVAALVGGMLGAAAGANLDAITNAVAIKDDLTMTRLTSKMMDAAIYDGVSSVLLAGVYKYGIHRPGKILLAKAGAAYRIFLGNQSAMGIDILMDRLNVSREVADDILGLFKNSLKSETSQISTRSASIVKNLLGTKPTDADVDLSILTQALPGGVSYLTAAGVDLPKIAQGPKKRAFDFNQVLDTLTSNNKFSRVERKDALSLLKSNLTVLKSEADEYYKLVKDEALNLTKDGIGIKSAYTNKQLIQKFVDFQKKHHIELRSFTETANSLNNIFYKEPNSVEQLFSIRSYINELKPGLKDRKLQEIIKDLLLDTDEALKRSVMQNTDKAAATTWAKNYENAKSVFADYKHLKTKTLLKELNADKTDIRDLGKTIVRNIATMDESYNLIMPKLNPEVRNKVEALVVKEISSLNTFGDMIPIYLLKL